MTIKEDWLGFRKRTIPPDAGVNQVQDMKAAFYAGFLCALDAAIMGTKDLNEDEGVEFLHNLWLELSEYVADLPGNENLPR